MKGIQKIKTRLINRILATNDESLLDAVDVILATVQPLEILSLSEEQIEILMMSEVDIASGNVLSEEELDNLDAQWM
jgi:hypothetical protein